MLQQFHGAAEGGRARGTFRVERGAGLLRNALASLSGLPKAGLDVPVMPSDRGERKPGTLAPPLPRADLGLDAVGRRRAFDGGVRADLVLERGRGRWAEGAL